MKRGARLHVSRIEDPGVFGRVAVMLGGTSSEREISLKSGEAVLRALLARQVDAHPWDPGERSLAEFASAGFDRVWNALHGPGGEDGVMQGALECLGVPYTGSGVMASALAMDKVRSKKLMAAADIPTPAYRTATSVAEARAAAEELGLPLVLKPARQGSSIGMSKVFEPAELEEGLRVALQFDDIAVIEECIVGAEITVAILQGMALPSVRIETPRVFYDYRAKYESDSTRYACPGTDDAVVEARYAELALRAFNELGCEGWGRVDFMHATDGEPMVLEVNTVPGMTSHSLVPRAARAAGIGFEELCWRVLETSVAQTPASIGLRAASNES
jgi:D-alanine-D-alanine ligase